MIPAELAVSAAAKILVPVLHAASHADSVHAAAEAAQARFHHWALHLEGWHDFFLMAGTAAVTLAGLLFVSISLHIETLIHETREHLLLLARAILFSFVMVLTVSLLLLVPPQSMKVTGTEIVVVGIVYGGIAVRLLRKARTDHPDFPRSAFRRRLIPTLIGYAMVMLMGAALIVVREPELLSWVVAPICMILGNAVGASWDLLVRTAKIKRRGESGAR